MDISKNQWRSTGGVNFNLIKYFCSILEPFLLVSCLCGSILYLYHSKNWDYDKKCFTGHPYSVACTNLHNIFFSWKFCNQSFTFQTFSLCAYDCCILFCVESAIYHIFVSRNTCYYLENQLWKGVSNRDTLLDKTCFYSEIVHAR